MEHLLLQNTEADGGNNKERRLGPCLYRMCSLVGKIDTEIIIKDWIPVSFKIAVEPSVVGDMGEEMNSYWRNIGAFLERGMFELNSWGWVLGMTQQLKNKVLLETSK